MTHTIKKIPEPKLREISFHSNMASPYEKNLRKRLNIKPLKIKPIEIKK